MKKLIVLILVFVLLSVTFVPALAANEGAGGKQLYALAGYIKEINTTEETITVDVLVGNRLADDFITADTETGWVTLVVTADTRLLLSGGTVITFDKFSRGDPVSSNGILTWDGIKPIFTATRITKGALLLNQ